MRGKGFAVPVYEDGVYRGLLTDGGIAGWVAGRTAKAMGTASIADILLGVSVGEVLASEKNPHRARFVSRRSTVYEVEEIFRENSKREKWRVAAVLITENGSLTKRAGIITLRPPVVLHLGSAIPQALHSFEGYAFPVLM